MRIVFFGTPDFAVASLKSLNESPYKVVAVVTTPDKQQGRGMRVQSSPVKQYAVENNIPVLQPDELSAPDFISSLKSYEADLFIIVAFRILPAEVFLLPKLCSFNLHGSVLPKYRGAAPIQWALINGEGETGLTTFKLAERVDTGNIIMQTMLPIDPEDNFSSLHDKMMILGADLVLKTTQILESGNYTLLPQDSSQATKAPKITKEHCLLDFGRSARDLHNLVRGVSPAPGAYFNRNGKVFKVYKTMLSDRKLAPGEVLEQSGEIYIGCSEGTLQILEIQAEGRKRLHAKDFLLGASLNENKA